MKTITLILFCFALNTTNIWGKDFHLIQTQLHGATADKPSESPIYVVLVPRKDDPTGGVYPVVYETFDPQQLGGLILGLLRVKTLTSGDSLYLDFSPIMAHPPKAEIQALTDYCKKIGITVIFSGTA
jgi:hypothetical protein